ncbi:hypothetical protein [Ereboglobus luteus]|uniref:Uncharacterized protein n=1 Tax=Ereboglobus luteus TaxID=1796921 RepID=A0A2U8E0D0_9BACT|nr:hypothetical protein [Ereboglobus luteus]AWI08290.1 hypothetical protein CKA38_02555 [Ereboglobus luteus]
MNTSPELEKPVSVGDWILTMIIFCIPVIGFIMMLVWALSSATTPSKRNFCRASLLLWIIGLVLGAIFLFAFGGLAMLGAANLQ